MSERRPERTLLETPESTQVESVIHVASIGLMIVFFRSGSVYSYEISPEEWKEFSKKETSKGSFLRDLQVYTKLRGKS